MIFGSDGKRIGNKNFECNGFEFDEIALAENPALMLMAAICIDPTELQKEFLTKAKVIFNDVNGKQIFPIVDETS